MSQKAIEQVDAIPCDTHYINENTMKIEERFKKLYVKTFSFFKGRKLLPALCGYVQIIKDTSQEPVPLFRIEPLPVELSPHIKRYKTEVFFSGKRFSLFRKIRVVTIIYLDRNTAKYVRDNRKQRRREQCKNV